MASLVIVAGQILMAVQSAVPMRAALGNHHPPQVARGWDSLVSAASHYFRYGGADVGRGCPGLAAAVGAAGAGAGRMSPRMRHQQPDFLGHRLIQPAAAPVLEDPVPVRSVGPACPRRDAPDTTDTYSATVGSTGRSRGMASRSSGDKPIRSSSSTAISGAVTAREIGHRYRGYRHHAVARAVGLTTAITCALVRATIIPVFPAVAPRSTNAAAR